MTPMKKSLLFLIILCLLVTGCAKKKTIRILCWAGYDETEIREHIENHVSDVKLEYVIYTGGEDMLRKFESNERNFDLLIVDAEYGKVLNDKGKLAPIDFSQRPTIKQNITEHYFDKFKNMTGVNQTPGFNIDGTNYCLIVRWGTVGLVAKKELGSEIHNKGYEVLHDKNRKIGIFDWYLPNMGIFSLMYLKNKGIEKNPYDLDQKELAEMYDTVMLPVRPNINSFHLELGLVIENAYKEQTDFVPGIGEWAIGNNVLKGNDSRDWYIPNEGGIMWIEALAIPKHIVNNQEKAQKVYSIVELFTTPELQAKLAWRQAYTAHVANRKAYDLMDDKQKEILKSSETEDILSKLYFRKVPDKNSLEWINLWTKFKNHK